MTFIPDKPLHSRFAFRNLTSEKYKAYAKRYSKAKIGYIRCTYALASGLEVLGIIKNVRNGKGKFATVCLGAATYVFTPVIAVCINVTKIVKVSKGIHGGLAYCFESVEDISNLVYLPLDIILFGQLIPVGSVNRFNLFENNNDFLDIL